MRNGIILKSPPEVALNFLFHEIWLDEFYSADGYEIGPNETVVDIGANIGVFALWAATRAKNVMVCSYEPFPKNAEYFLANQRASRMDNIRFRAAAVAGSEGVRTLRVDDSWILHSLADKDSDVTGIVVESVSLDSILTDIPICHFLKLDCEGGEYEIIYAAERATIAKIKRVICEFNVLDRDRRNGEALARYLEQCGFVVDELKSLDDRSGVLRAKRH